jgi:iron complex outermembrane receptor protein
MLLGGAASSALLLGAPLTANAQDTATGVDEVVVTAQRREERLQDVPISIAALNPQAMAAQLISDVSDLRGKVAGLSITSWAGSNASNLVSIRGISGQPLPIGANQATAIYLDGVYLSRPDAAFFGLDDVERLEVLRGPQGTLYGRNATAGAINIITRAPTRTLVGGLTASYGSYGTYDVRGSISGPLSEHLAFGLSGNFGGHGNYYTNTFTGNKVGDKRKVTGRAKLRYESDSGAFDATLSVDASETSGPDYYKSGINAAGAYIGIGNPKLISTSLREDLFKHYIRATGAALVANYKLSDSLTATSVTSWRHVSTGSIWDNSGTAPSTSVAAIFNKSNAFSQEFRSVYTGDKLTVTAGVNYYNEKANLAYSVNAPPAPDGTLAPYDNSFNEAWAAFAQAEYKLTDQLTATAGLRYNYDRRSFIIDYRYAGPIPAGIGFGRIHDSVVLPAFGLNYKPTQDTMVYAKVSQGYQAPGFNFLPGIPNPPVNPVTGQRNPPAMNTFDAEKMWAYEVGFKSQWFERRLTFNMSGFYYDYLNINVRDTISPGVALVSDAGKASVKGVETELTWKIIDGLSLNGRVTYAKSEYKDYCQPISGGTPISSDAACTSIRTGVGLPGADRSGNRLPNSPAWSGGVGLEYTRPIGDMQLSASVTYSFETKAYFNAVNEIAVSNGDGWQRVDARVGLELPNEVELFAFGRNLTNDQYFGYVVRTGPRNLFGTLSDPRIYGVGLKYRF